jgi:2-oxoglutarate dehydrogenase E2 component (dihydrolipoamide succinyltransferase)
MTAQPSLLPTGRTEKLSRLRRTIAHRMVESLHVAAQLTTVVEVDFHAVAALRKEVNAELSRSQGPKLSFLPFIARAVLELLPVHPVINASVDIENGQATYFASRNLAVAVDTERGLVAPVIREAGALSVVELARRIGDLADMARSGKLAPDDLAGGTFTITNTGSRGALFDTPIINQPQVAILGTGAIVDRAVVVGTEGGGKEIVIRPMGYLALSYDHRLVDGADAARFLGDLKRLLERPE